MRAVVLSAFLFVLSIASAARAEAPPTIDANGCIDGASFAKRLAARGVVAADGTIAEVRTTDLGMVVEGTLVLRRVMGVTTRVMRAPSCDDVADALAFTLALALEMPPDEPAPPPPPTPPAAIESTALAKPPPAEPPPAKPAPLELGAAIAGGASTGPGPDAAASLDLALTLHTSTRSWLAPALVAGPSFVFPSTYEAALYPVTVAFQGGTADLCPLRFGARAGARLCGRFVAGRSQVASDGFVGPRLDQRLYLAAGASIRGELPIHGRISIMTIVSATAPFSRDAYFVGISRAFEVPATALSASFGAGVSIP